VSFLSSPRLHLVMSYVWALLVIPTLLFWKSSILWVAAMSLYANFIGPWSAYQAARAERMAAVAREQNAGDPGGRDPRPARAG
jgi:hypothetical protein